jgi:hypothetical protein
MGEENILYKGRISSIEGPLFFYPDKKNAIGFISIGLRKSGQPMKSGLHLLIVGLSR